MQSTGHSSMHALSLRATQGCAMTYVTGAVLLVRRAPDGTRWSPPSIADAWCYGRGEGRMSGRIGPRVGPSDVGQRVVLRRRAAGGRFADVLGDLLAWDVEAATARVRTRAGEVAVPLADVVAGKVVPPPPPRRGAPHRVLGWAALEDVAADGVTGRANSVLAVGEPDDVGTPVAVAVDAVERWYGERGLPARFAVPWPLGAPRLDDGARDVAPDPELRARGYLLDTPTLFLTASLREVAAALARDVAADQLALSLSDSPDDGWLGVYRYRGQELPAVAPRVLVSAPAQAFVQLRDGG